MIDPIVIAIIGGLALLGGWQVVRWLQGHTKYGRPVSVSTQSDLEEVSDELLRGELAEEKFFTLKAGSDEQVVQVIGGNEFPLLFLTGEEPKPALRKLGFDEKPAVKEGPPRLKPMEMASDRYGVFAAVEADGEAVARWGQKVFHRVHGVSDISTLTLYIS